MRLSLPLHLSRRSIPSTTPIRSSSISISISSITLAQSLDRCSTAVSLTRRLVMQGRTELSMHLAIRLALVAASTMPVVLLLQATRMPNLMHTHTPISSTHAPATTVIRTVLDPHRTLLTSKPVVLIRPMLPVQTAAIMADILLLPRRRRLQLRRASCRPRLPV